MWVVAAGGRGVLLRAPMGRSLLRQVRWSSVSGYPTFLQWTKGQRRGLSVGVSPSPSLHSAPASPPPPPLTSPPPDPQPSTAEATAGAKRSGVDAERIEGAESGGADSKRREGWLRYLWFYICQVKTLPAVWRQDPPKFFFHMGAALGLIAMMRNDVIAIKTTNLASTVSSIVYHYTRTHKDARDSLAWALIFAVVNLLSLIKNWVDDQVGARTTEELERIYEMHFLNSGVPHKLCIKLLGKAERHDLQQGHLLRRTGEIYNDLTLIVNGKAEARWTLHGTSQ
eukprot:Hpha_TRINITY_DN24491_c0_g1::TRINITY_DN24491_c0_g1_i1::g.165662::m.165662